MSAPFYRYPEGSDDPAQRYVAPFTSRPGQGTDSLEYVGGEYYDKPGDDVHNVNLFQRWTLSLPYSEGAKGLIGQAFELAYRDWQALVAAGMARGEIPSGGSVQEPYLFANYLAAMDVDMLLWALSPQEYYRNAASGAVGLSPEERQVLVSQADRLAQMGRNQPLTPELAEQLDPGYAMQAYLSRSGLTSDEQGRLARYYQSLLNQSRAEGAEEFRGWLSQHPARELLAATDPQYALDQYLAGSRLSNEAKQALKQNFDSLLYDWRQAGQPGTFSSWLGSGASGTASGQAGVGQAAERYDPQYAFSAWLSRGGGALSDQGRQRAARAYDDLYQSYTDRGGANSFADYLAQRSPAQVAQSQQPQDLGQLIGRTRVLSF